MRNHAREALPSDCHNAVANSVKKYCDVSNCTLMKRDSAKIKPVVNSLILVAKPIRAKPRKYNTVQAQFLNNFVADLISKGIIYSIRVLDRLLVLS